MEWAGVATTLRAVPASQDTVIAVTVHAWRGDERSESLEELEGVSERAVLPPGAGWARR